MAGNKKMTNAEIKKRREQKRLYQRKYKEKIKADPIKYEEMKRKDRELYYKRKDKGTAKSITDLTPRQQRTVRKNWRVASKRYREKQSRQSLDVTDASTSSTLSTENTVSSSPKTPTTKAIIEKKISRKNRDSMRKKMDSLQSKVDDLQKQLGKYRMRISRLSRKNVNDVEKPSPVKNIENILEGQNVTSDVRKKLLFGEVLSKQIKVNLNEASTSSEKRSFKRLLNGDEIKKYRMTKQLSLTIGRTRQRQAAAVKRRKIEKARMAVQIFLEHDEHSRATAGKKETITRRKNKKQIRFLSESMRNLHKIFVRTSQYKRMSYSRFCKLRPFWILQPKAQSRNTCMCKTHANIGFMVSALKQVKIINQSTPEDVARSLCCDGELRQQCLERVCDSCKYKALDLNAYQKHEKTAYERWITKENRIILKGKVKLCKRTVKEKVFCSKFRLVKILEKSIIHFMQHLCNMLHQYRATSQIKKNLKHNEALLHIDFSENYTCKYGEEVQSAHFGASKQQLTIHTSVFYYHSNNSTISESFATVSENLRHDPTLICIHLNPVLQHCQNLVPNLKTLHVLSDGPSTQYRNKTMFQLMVNHIAKQLDVENLVWHYTESGHGKGAPDGVGGCLKRTTDAEVAKGKDISNFTSFVSCLVEKCPGICVIPVKDSDISEVEKTLENKYISTFKGTMKIHQLAWSKKQPQYINVRRLSCIECLPEKRCHHYGIGYIPVSNGPSKPRLRYSEVYTSSDSENDIEPEDDPQPLNVGVNDYVLVKLTTTKVQEKYFVAHVMSSSGNELRVKFMRRCGRQVGTETFSFPMADDIASIYLNEVVKKLQQPSMNSRTQYIFDFDISKYKPLY